MPFLLFMDALPITPVKTNLQLFPSILGSFFLILLLVAWSIFFWVTMPIFYPLYFSLPQSTFWGIISLLGICLLYSPYWLLFPNNLIIPSIYLFWVSLTFATVLAMVAKFRICCPSLSLVAFSVSMRGCFLLFNLCGCFLMNFCALFNFCGCFYHFSWLLFNHTLVTPSNFCRCFFLVCASFPFFCGCFIISHIS